jgi:hypothetical protein
VILIMLALIFRAVLAPIITLIPAVLVLLLSGPVIAQASILSPAALGIEGGAPGDNLGLRLPDRLSYQVEHSACLSRALGFDNGASGDDASASPRLPGRVYNRLLFHSVTCP